MRTVPPILWLTGFVIATAIEASGRVALTDGTYLPPCGPSDGAWDLRSGIGHGLYRWTLSCQFSITVNGGGGAMPVVGIMNRWPSGETSN